MRNLTLFSLSSLFIACQEQPSENEAFSSAETSSSAFDQSLQLNSSNVEYQAFSEYLSAKTNFSNYEQQLIDDACIFGGVVSGEIDRSDAVAPWHFDLKDEHDVKLLDVRGTLPQYDVQLISLSPESKLDFSFEQSLITFVDDETIEITYEKELFQVEIDAYVHEFSKVISGEWYICQI